MFTYIHLPLSVPELIVGYSKGKVFISCSVAATLSSGLLCFLLSLVCKIRSGTTELSKPVSITVEVYEGKVEGRYSIDGKAEIPGFTFVVQTPLSRVSESHQIAEKHLSSSFSPQRCIAHPLRSPTSQKSIPTMGRVSAALSSQ